MARISSAFPIVLSAFIARVTNCSSLAVTSQAQSGKSPRENNWRRVGDHAILGA